MINQPILNQFFSFLFHLDSTFFDIHIHFTPHHVALSCHICTNSKRTNFSSDLYLCHQKSPTHEANIQQMQLQKLHNQKKKLKTYQNSEINNKMKPKKKSLILLGRKIINRDNFKRI